MTRVQPLDLESVASDALQEAGVPASAALAAARLTTAAICQHLMGCRVTFGSAALQTYRDRAIYELSRQGASSSLGELEHLSARHVRRIVSTIRRRKGA